LFGILKRTIRMFEALYKSDAFVVAVKVIAILVIASSALELLRLHGIVPDKTMFLEIFYAAVIGVAARVVVELSRRPRLSTARKTDVAALRPDALAARFGELDLTISDDDRAVREATDERPPYRQG
jgi:hypothetical protein